MPDRASDRAALTELFAHALRPAPHLNYLGAAFTDLAQVELTGEPLLVEPPQHPEHRLRSRRLPEAVGDRNPPVPLRLRIRLGVDQAEVDGSVDVSVFVIDPQIELEVGPVGRQRIEHILKVLGECHQGEA